MSRFNNLEFGDQREEHSASRAELKDEQFYLAEAKTAFAAGRFEQALRHFAKVLEFSPKHPAAWAGQVRMLIELGEFREAKLWADKGLELIPDDPELLAAKAVALARDGDLSAALIFSDAAIESRGQTPYVWLARDDVLLARREKRADFCFERALGLVGPAQNSFEQARQLDPQCQPSPSERAQVSENTLATRLRGWWRQWFQR
ncbi:MAG: tetratricopeptide repeat protein [Verrucomicrobia bacterium]|nr:tetratricopeptide repeat protein [Verrucomicrobiota bacterium]